MSYSFIEAYILAGEQGLPIPVKAWIIGFIIKEELRNIWFGVIQKHDVFSEAHVSELAKQRGDRFELILLIRDEPSSEQLHAVELIASELKATVTFPGNIMLASNQYAEKGEFTEILRWMKLF